MSTYSRIILFSLFIVLKPLYGQLNLDSLRNEIKQIDKAEKEVLLLKYELLADGLYTTEQNDSAIKYLEIVAQLAKEIKNKETLSEAYSKLGVLYQYKGEFEKGNQFNFKGLAIKKEIGASSASLAASHSNIALSYQEQGKLEEAIEHQKTSMNYSLAAKDSNQAATRYYMIGGILYQQSNYDSALFYYNKAYNFFKKSGDKVRLAMYHIYVGLIYLKKDKLFKAKQAFHQSLEEMPEEGNKRMKVFIYSNLSVAYLVIGAERDSVGRFHLNRCIQYAEETYNQAKDLSFLRQMRKASEVLYKAHEALGNYSTALEHAKEYIVLNDSMYNENQQRTVEELQEKYETEKKELQIAFLNDENKIKAANLSQAKEIQRNQQTFIILLIIGLLILLILAVWIYRIYLQKRKANLALEKKNQLIAKQKEKNELLLKEIHHRVKNNLQVISSLLDLQSDDIQDRKALSAIEDGQSRVKAMALIHQKLYQNEEIGIIPFREYTHEMVKQLRSLYTMEKNIEVIVKSEEVEVDIDTAIPLGLILNELVSNAFKHAFNQAKDGKLWIRLKQLKPGEYLLQVADNGVGVPVDFDIWKTKSLGLRLVRRLSKQLYGRCEVISEEGVTFEVYFKDTKSRKEVE